jgi:hypothetical protein
MIRTTSITRKTLSSLAAALLMASPLSSVLAQDTYCDPKLGRDFDLQTDEVRMARMNVYFDCRQTQDFRFLETKRKHMLTGIQRWQSRATQVARTTLRTKRNIFDAELRTIHLGQRSDLTADIAQRFAELEASRLPTNRAEIDSQRRELGTTRNSEITEQNTRQRQEVILLRGTLSQCTSSVNNALAQLMNEDSKSVREQFLAKSIRLSDEYRTVKGTAMSQTLQEHLDSLNSEDGVIGTIAEMEGSGTITSGESGDVVEATEGADIRAGDVVEMGEDSGCSIVFVDHSAANIGSETRAEIDEYVYNPDNDERNAVHTFIRGIFLFTSGLIGSQELSDVDVRSEAIGNLGIRG